MAGIDKIYGTNDQYDEFHQWVEDNNPGLLKHFYPKEGFDRKPAGPITNFPEKHDIWLFENCPINWVVERIADQYEKSVQSFMTRDWNA